MEIEGIIKAVNETQVFGNNGFRKRELILTTQDQYPQVVCLEFVQDKVDLLDKLRSGQKVKVGINIRGREWINPQGEAKYFNTIQGWKIENIPDEGSYDNKAPLPPSKEVFEMVDVEYLDEKGYPLPF